MREKSVQKYIGTIKALYIYQSRIQFVYKSVRFSNA